MRLAILLPLLATLSLVMPVARADDQPVTPPAPDVAAGTDGVTMSDDLPDPMTLLKASDALFSRQGIQTLAAQVVVYRDSANEISLEDLGADRITQKTLIPLRGRYEYWEPGGYNFYLLGMLIASSEAGGKAQTMASPLLPMPGGILTNDALMARFRARVTGIASFDDTQKKEDCYVVRLNPIDPDKEFFQDLTYYISTDDQHLMRGVRVTFEGTDTWVGTGWGTFYYRDDHNGHVLPFLGTGVINFRNPDRRVALKGKWRDFSLNNPEDIRKNAIDTDAPKHEMSRESTVKSK